MAERQIKSDHGQHFEDSDGLVVRHRNPESDHQYHPLQDGGERHSRVCGQCLHRTVHSFHQNTI